LGLAGEKEGGWIGLSCGERGRDGCQGRERAQEKGSPGLDGLGFDFIKKHFLFVLKMVLKTFVKPNQNKVYF
jgi:hypothetical protein